MNDLHNAFPEIDPLHHPKTGRLRYLERTIKLIGAELDRREAEETESIQKGEVFTVALPSRVGAPASGDAQSVASTRTRRKPGPKPNWELALRIKGVVDSVAEGVDLSSRLDDACEALDNEKIPVPPTWRKKRIATWADSCMEQRDKTLKLIDYWVAQADKGPQKSQAR